MIDKFREYRLVSGSVMPARDKQHLPLVKKVPLRELPNESKNIINRPLANSPLPKDSVKGFTFDSGKGTGTKRQRIDGPVSPSCFQSHGKSSLHRNLVYVRRKLEAEQGKMGALVNVNDAESPESSKFSNNCTGKSNMQDLMQETGATCFASDMSVLAASLARTSSAGLSFPHSHGKSIPRLAGPELHDSVVISRTPVPADLFKVNNEGWKDRFIQLQMFLKTCDQSNQEDYIQMLRSLSAVGRSKHAVELENRAIHLSLEEGKEWQRMKALNVLDLGKTSPNDQASDPIQMPFSITSMVPDQ